nr:MFS transporter [Candidatus Sigynarchaeota archaeon]
MTDMLVAEAPREITGRRLLTFNLVSIGGLLVTSLYSSYSFYYYTYVIGLDALLSSIGSVIALFTAAIACPVFGVLSDNRPTRKGKKRKPFFAYGLPLLVASSILVWLPPENCQPGQSMNWLVAIYFWTMSFVVFLTASMISSAYYGMIPEQSTTEANRIVVSKIQGLFNLAANAVAIIMPIVLQAILPDPQHSAWYEPSGNILISIVPAIAIIFSIACGLFTIITYFTVDESFLRDPAERKSVPASLKTLFSPLGNRNARVYFGYSFTMQAGAKVLITLPIPFLTYVLVFQGPAFMIYLGIALALNFIGLSIWNIIVKRRGVIWANQLSMIILVITLNAVLIVLLGIPREIMLPIVLVDCLVAMFSTNAGYLTNVPIVSAIVDEVSIQKVKKETVSGLYFGLNGFFCSLGVVAGSLFMGLYFTGGQERNPILITLAYSVISVTFLIAAILNKKLSLPALKR